MSISQVKFKQELGPQKRACAWSMIAVWLLLNAASVCPELHHLFHADSDLAGHECFVTQFANGCVSHVSVAEPLVLPPPASFESYIVADVEHTSHPAHRFPLSCGPPTGDRVAAPVKMS